MNIALLILLLLVAVFLLLWLLFEKGKTDEKVVAVIATLGAFAAVARVPFAAIPNVQPTTFLVMLSGYVFGVRVGFLVGAIAAVLSNLFFGQGPWTIWQMLSWGLAGASGGALGAALEGRRNGPLLASPAKRWTFTAVCALWGYLFGWIMNLWVFLGLGSALTWKSFVAVYLASVAFDTAHALGNAFFAALFAHGFAAILVRYHRKLVVARVPAEYVHSGEEAR